MTFKAYWHKELVKAFKFFTIIAFDGESDCVPTDYQKPLFEAVDYYIRCAAELSSKESKDMIPKMPNILLMLIEESYQKCERK